MLLSYCDIHAQVQGQYEFYKGPVDQPFQIFIADLLQDNSGYLWLADYQQLVRFDGVDYVRYPNPDHKTKPDVTDHIECLALDSNGIVWIGYVAGGLESFDPKTGKFTQYLHSSDPASLSIDTVAALLVDHENQLWVGTHRGLDLLDRKTGKFKHYRYSANDSSSLSDDQVRALYMDRNKDIWVGTRSPFPNDESYPNTGGLNRLDKITGRFVRYMHDPRNPNTLADNHIRVMFEDSQGNFWIGTGKSGINLLDRKTGMVQRQFKAGDTSKVKDLPSLVSVGSAIDHITFITEDGSGSLWFGSLGSGICKFDPRTGKQEPFSAVLLPESGLKIASFWRGVTTKDGSMWMTSFVTPQIIRRDPFDLKIPFQALRSDGNSFYEDSQRNLWIAHTNGLAKRDAMNGRMTAYIGDSVGNPQSFQASPFNKNSVLVIRGDSKGNIWMGMAYTGLEVFDPRSEKVIERFPLNTKTDKGTMDSTVNMLLFEDKEHLWIGTDKGLDLLTIPEKKFTHFQSDEKDPESIVSGQVFSIIRDAKGSVWISGNRGVSRYNKSKNKFDNYLRGIKTTTIFADASQQLWAGTDNGLYKFETENNEFRPFVLKQSVIPLVGILNIIEDNDQQLWISTANGIFKINRERNELFLLGKELGIFPNAFLFADNIKTSEGKIVFGYPGGYYEIDPAIKYGSTSKPMLKITDFRLGGRSIFNAYPDLGKIERADSAFISLDHDQNIFSIDFNSIQFRHANDFAFVYRLSGYDDEWRRTNDKRAYYFNVPPGKYLFEVRAFSTNGVFSEKKIEIRIANPWWERWWAYILFTAVAALMVWAIVQYRSRSLLKEKRVLEESVKKRTAEVVQQKEEISQQRDEIEKALNDLKAAQDQLVQKEKMASLGELTAGIAHEIQNPLNFVNNFSEVNEELSEELGEEIQNGNKEAQQSLLNEIRSNNEKISHHGKRADSIVKSMLQHSRTNAGVKEEADINALADEYMRLAYHGHRAKDKTFNSTLETEFDPAANKVYIMPQEIGRVLLNLFNNAFYAVAERKKQEPGYSPKVKVTTRLNGNNVIVTVSDNGIGMNDQVKAKIFQPFFTTKPTGQGTGLGMSLSYDIITKGHNGQFSVQSAVGEGSVFEIRIPY